MKKKNLKSLDLNKKSISNLKNVIFGGEYPATTNAEAHSCDGSCLSGGTFCETRLSCD